MIAIGFTLKLLLTIRRSGPYPPEADLRPPFSRPRQSIIKFSHHIHEPPIRHGFQRQLFLGFRHVLLKSRIFVEKKPPRFLIEPAQNTLEGKPPRLDALEQLSHGSDILHRGTFDLSLEGPGRPKSASRSGP